MFPTGGMRKMRQEGPVHDVFPLLVSALVRASPLDVVVIAVYLVGITAFGIRVGCRQVSRFLLRHMRIPPKRSQCVHTHTLPFASFEVKRPPEYQAGDQRQF